MRISSGSVVLSKDRFYAEDHNEKENLIIVKNNKSVKLSSNSERSDRLKKLTEDSILLSKTFDENKDKAIDNKISDNNNKIEPIELKIDQKDLQKINIIKKMIKMISGKDIKFNIPELYENKTEKELPELKIPIDKDKVKKIIEKSQNQMTVKNNTQNNNVIYHYSKQISHYEHERLDFSAKGLVETEDGKKIDIDLNIHMSRDFASEEYISMTNGEKIDPLVINFDGNGIDLSEEKLEFDLDFDGNTENISFTSSGTGFLALDKNKNNSIDDGSELFGTRSGNGFEDLKRYDSDKNGWIDENDTVFEDLVIWATDESGEKKLFSLYEKGIGAIYLKGIESIFNFKDSQTNKELGTLANSSIFLKENGKAGMIGQIDLTV